MANAGEMVRETYEWANIWWDHAEETDAKRILLVGDSISVGYGSKVTELLAGKVRVDRLSNSRSINDPALAIEQEYMLGQNRYAVVHFNNGLHGVHLSCQDYVAGLRGCISRLRRLAPDAALVWSNSTPYMTENDMAKPSDRNPQVIERNAAAAKVMAENGIEVVDLYSLAWGKPDYFSQDGVHYNAKGYEVLGTAVANAIKRHL